MIQRIALYSTMGLLLQALGHTWDTWQFWSMLSLFWASERLTKQEQHEQSYVQGILMYIALEPQQQQELAQAIQQVENNHND
jgi:hypothetical protein